jgi:hypothetical protein
MCIAGVPSHVVLADDFSLPLHHQHSLQERVNLHKISEHAWISSGFELALALIEPESTDSGRPQGKEIKGMRVGHSF